VLRGVRDDTEYKVALSQATLRAGPRWAARCSGTIQFEACAW